MIYIILSSKSLIHSSEIFILFFSAFISVCICANEFSFLSFLSFFFFFCLFSFSRSAPAAYGGSQARGQIGAVASGLRLSHSNAGSEPCLQSTPQLTATPDR